MSTQQSTIDFLLEQIAEAGTVRARKMFGEYAICCEEKVVALVCDDQFFIKPTEAGKKLLNSPTEKPPYPGAKPYFWISGEFWDDQDMMCELVRVTAKDLPLPKKKKTR